MEEWYDVDVQKLLGFVSDVFVELDCPPEHARIIADVLVEADRRGVASHGVARLRRYVDGIRNGLMYPGREGKVVKETPTTLTIDGEAGMGQVVAHRAMNMVIDKARDNNVAFAAVRNSNHYGIAGYYSMMALEADMIGISMTNSAPLVVPTFGRNAILGTNPLSIAVPRAKGQPIVLDMATSTVPRGKLEVYARMGKKIPLHWATDENGRPTDNPSQVLENMLERRGGGLLPLGGADEETGGHKGYGLSLMVDIFSGILSGGTFGQHIYENKGQPPGVCHFFGAIRIDAFTDPEIFDSMLSAYIEELKNSEKREGHDRIYIHGEKEMEMYLAQKERVRIYHTVVDDMKGISDELGLDFDLL